MKNLKYMPNSKILLNEDNILNYHAYFSKRYYKFFYIFAFKYGKYLYFSTGFRLEISEKGKTLVKNFENNLKKSIEKCESQMNCIEKNA